MPVMYVEIGFKKEPDLLFRAEMWRDDIRTLQQMMTAMESREVPDFQVITLSDGGMLTIDMSEVLFVNAGPYAQEENTTIEVEYIDDDYGDD